MDLYWILGLFYIGVPTAFAYGLAIGLVWAVLRWRRAVRAPLRAAVLTVVGAAVLLSIFGNLITMWRRQQVTATDVTPARPIALSGDVLIDPVFDHREPDAAGSKWEVVGDEVKQMRATGRYQGATSCGRLCRKVLAMPGVRSVIVNPEHGRIDGISPHAIRYRLGTSDCGVEAGNSWDTIETSSAWMSEPIIDSCAVAGPPPARFDFAIRYIKGQMYADNRPRDRLVDINLLPRPAYYMRAEITDADGRPLLRRTVAPPPAIAVPLVSGGGPLEIGLEIAPGDDPQADAALATLKIDRVVRAHTIGGGVPPR